MAVMVTALTRASEHIASSDFANAKLLSVILLFALGQAASVVFDKITWRPLTQGMFAFGFLPPVRKLNCLAPDSGVTDWLMAGNKYVVIPVFASIMSG